MTVETDPQSSLKSKPVDEIRLGTIKAAFWKNDTETGPRYNVTFSRLYRQGEEWRSTESFGRDDLLLLAKLADQAHTWILNQGREFTSTSGPAGPDLSGAKLPKRSRQA